MSDLKDAEELLMQITKQTVSTGNPSSTQRAVVILLKDYIERTKSAEPLRGPLD